MISSRAFDFVLHGEPANMYVVRNNGHCWGRVVTEGGRQFDVESRSDQYDESDADAAEAFIRQARRKGALSEPYGYEDCFVFHPRPLSEQKCACGLGQ